MRSFKLFLYIFVSVLILYGAMSVGINLGEKVSGINSDRISAIDAYLEED